MSRRMIYRDWALTMIAFGVFLIAVAATVCALFVMVISVVFLVTEGQPGYILVTLVALGFSCLFGAGVHWGFTSMMDA